MKLEVLKNTIQSCNINFLIGSGLSLPYLITLGNIETLLEALEKITATAEEKNIVKASLYKIYFEEVMLKNLKSYKPIGDDEENYKTTLTNYNAFIKWLNSILLYRYMPIHSKQINLFTTNIDLFFEKAFESTMVESNDGFKGRLEPVFSLSNFQKSYRKTSLHYKNTSEIPVFNLLKLHGSINWKKEKEQIFLSNFSELKKVEESLSKLSSSSFLKITNDSKIEDLIKEASKKLDSIDNDKLLQFFNAYEHLQIVNPTKEKFKTTLLNNYYYELLRLFANEMEKENTLLFALGFSFADEHIREITIRAVNSNPTLQLYVIAYHEQAKIDIEDALGFSDNRLLNGNVQVIDPKTFYNINKEDESISSFDNFSFDNINKMIFELISNRSNPTFKIDG